MILLSSVTKSNWYVFHAEGPKPTLYEKLPLVFAGSRHGVSGERIVREKNPITCIPQVLVSGSSSPNDKRKSSGSVKNAELIDESDDAQKSSGSVKLAEPIEESDDSETPSAIHVREFSPVRVLCEENGRTVHGLLKKEGDKIVIKHKGSLYSIDKFSRLVCADQEFSAAEKIRIRETDETLQKFLDSQSTAAATQSKTDSRGTKRSSSGEPRSVGTHFFDEETPG